MNDASGLTPRLVLGVDPGTRVAGWGVVADRGGELVLVDAGVVRASAELPASDRLKLVFEGMQQVLGKHAVDLVAIEEAFFGKNVHSALRLGEGRAVAILAATLANRPLLELAPSRVKKAVTGHGGATKDQVRASVEAILAKGAGSLASLPADATDALALAIAGHARAGAAGGAPAHPRGRRRARGRWSESDVARVIDLQKSNARGAEGEASGIDTSREART